MSNILINIKFDRNMMPNLDDIKRLKMSGNQIEINDIGSIEQYKNKINQYEQEGKEYTIYINFDEGCIH